MSQIIGMAKRLQEAEATIVELKKALAEQMAVEAEKSPTPGPASEELTITTTRSIPRARAAIPRPAYGLSNSGSNASRESTTEELLSDLSLDASGKICYYGSTSAVHDPAAFAGRSPNFPSFEEQNSKVDVRTLLTSNAMESRTWEEFAIGNAAVQNDIPREIMSRLLKIHWAWISPMFMWVYRPAFMRDMMTGGQYYSPLLLNVMCGHAARFNDRRIAEPLIARARLLLGTEIHKPSSITTVQALLQLSARDLAYGHVSQAWTYSGIAFRMVSDLGLRHSSGSIYSLGSLNAEDLEIRRRLFWSCYFWDKAMSLYLGRTPALTELPSTHAPELLDDFAEHDLWVPDDTGLAGSDKAPASGFPPMKFHVVSCFVNSCKLAVIISDIILHLYSSHHEDDGDITLRAIRERLDDWRALTPEHLKLEPDNLPSRCPPPHIVSQNLLYYATIILLHRPFNSLPIHHAACRQAADSAERLLILFEGTFGFTKLSYLSAYCIYTSASVMVQDAKAGDALASRKTETFLRALNVAAKTCQLIQRSLDIITNSLNAEGTRPAAVGKSNQTSENNLLNRQYLPAFLYRDAQINFPSTSNVGGMDIDASSLLDCFPEQHMENSSTSNWYLPS
ncbi:putative Fungal-specific transcription factor domain-containing protein [Seiridium cardinale]|uniref:Fungal-specific transcription factor domain-containing protein n=1 Tax=Seiridium cardinale TaxID=138064 RepID=A0ABR2Y1E8_9PEZI